MAAGLSLVAGYLIGGVPFGYLIARARGVDIRKVASGNIGATNVGRALGRRWGLVVLALDVAKGFAPVLFLAGAVACWLSADFVNLVRAATGLGAILGHVFTPYLGLKGGKGVATSIGVFAALLSYWIALPLAAYVLARRLSGFVSAGSTLLAILLPVAAYFRCMVDPHLKNPAGAWPVIALAGLACVLVLVRHSANIVRLARGTEHPAGGDRTDTARAQARPAEERPERRGSETR